MVGVVVIVVLVMDVVERRLGQGDLSRRCWRVKRRSIGIVLLLRVMQIRLLDNRAHVDIFKQPCDRLMTKPVIRYYKAKLFEVVI